MSYFILIKHLVCRLNIILSAAFVAYKIYLKSYTLLFAFFIALYNRDNADIDIEAPNTQFIIDNIFHHV